MNDHPAPRGAGCRSRTQWRCRDGRWQEQRCSLRRRSARWVRRISRVRRRPRCRSSATRQPFAMDLSRHPSPAPQLAALCGTFHRAV